MRLDLLWWRHLRAPREHVAEPERFNYAQFIDMGEMLKALDPMPDGKWVTSLAPREPGTYFNQEGKWVKSLALRRRNPDDWFAPAPEWEVQIEPPAPSIISWLEDDFMPRIITDPKLRRSHAIITNIADA